MTRRKSVQKPDKPRSDYPLSAHPCGQWCKKVYGKLYYFGPWDDPEGALEEYHRRLPEITGQPDEQGSVTVRQMCNKFLHTKKLLVDAGQLKQRTWDEYKHTSERLCRHFGPARPIDSLTVSDFEALKAALPATWALASTNGFVIKTRAILNYAYQHELIDRPIRTGDTFRRATQKQMRIARAQGERKFFEATEIHALVDGASEYLRAMILCGVNLGFGNRDCATLRKNMLDLEAGWFSQYRSKTGVLRTGKMWPETIDALRWVIDHPRRQCKPGLADRVFVTKYGNEYSADKADDAISKEFCKLAKRVGVWRKGVGFYALRHVTQTIGEGAGDPAAVKVLMGHVDPSISEKYREYFDRERVDRVCQHIRTWYLAGKS